ncbi:Nucleotide-diphospho-sugar transferase family protein [Striga hermonthica]|uniref:Nucleotide-diphospho-sugar transferase family protein n=1 Tax=Striga hermonthica TaxID=68872 RepID=A0A9N7NTA0_STRHE|nr:Nucleotide-diphospho-sugar transferase family protein [Striga hermonthica]
MVKKDDLQIALEKASMANKTLIVAFVNKAYVEPHEDEYPTMLDLFLEGFWAGEGTGPLLGHLLVVSMDRAAHRRCEFRRLNCYELPPVGGGDFAGEKVYMSDGFIEMMWRRTRFLLEVLNRGFSFVFTDTDVLWLRNPFTRLMINTENTLDIQISTDRFNGNSTSEKNPINTGFYFVRSNKNTISLFQTWYNTRKNLTGLKEQDVLANLIRDGIFTRLGLRIEYLDTLYFSGFCKDSRDIELVATVHANCCRSIAAKVADLKRENVLAESRMMVPDCRKRLESALTDLKGTLAELEESGEQGGSEYNDARIIVSEVSLETFLK